MTNFIFGTTSKQRLGTCHPDLIKVFETALQHSPVDFGIAAGHRSAKEQYKLYQQGRTIPGSIVTNIDGYNKKGKHNESPSNAVDVYAWVNDKASWDSAHLTLIAGVVLTSASYLNVNIRWGGNWDGDGEIISDQNLIDLPHFELY